VILFILLSGRPPFGGETDKEILDNVKQGVYSFASSEWKSVSLDAKDLIKQMLCFDQQQRISAVQALNHPWIVKQVHDGTDLSLALGALSNLRTFRVS
jgi:calcium-dependent protein kinase